MSTQTNHSMNLIPTGKVLGILQHYLREVAKH